MRNVEIVAKMMEMPVERSSSKGFEILITTWGPSEIRA